MIIEKWESEVKFEERFLLVAWLVGLVDRMTGRYVDFQIMREMKEKLNLRGSGDWL